MKRILIITISFLLICLIIQMGIFASPFVSVGEDSFVQYTGFYFNQLDLAEKEMYVKIDNAVKEKSEKVFLGIHESDMMTEKVGKVLKAYFYDFPDCYYISNKYTIFTHDLKLFAYTTLKFEYIVKAEDIQLNDKKLELAIDNILQQCISENMTDFEKELAIHDTMVKQVNYYQYEDINMIPGVKHTAYGALVDKEAVCDGYAKAFKMLLDKVGIDNIIINGETEGVAHAWNLVKLQDEYYHVDVTSDKMEYNSKKYVIHKYFNMDDKAITNTHTIDSNIKYPNCQSNVYAYYKFKGYEVGKNDNLHNKLKDIITAQKKCDTLEIMVHNAYSDKKIIEALYFLNFNNWKIIGKKEVVYNKLEDVYIFVK